MEWCGNEGMRRQRSRPCSREEIGLYRRHGSLLGDSSVTQPFRGHRFSTSEAQLPDAGAVTSTVTSLSRMDAQVQPVGDVVLKTGSQLPR